MYKAKLEGIPAVLDFGLDFNYKSLSSTRVNYG